MVSLTLHSKFRCPTVQRAEKWEGPTAHLKPERYTAPSSLFLLFIYSPHFSRLKERQQLIKLPVYISHTTHSLTMSKNNFPSHSFTPSPVSVCVTQEKQAEREKMWKINYEILINWEKTRQQRKGNEQKLTWLLLIFFDGGGSWKIKRQRGDKNERARIKISDAERREGFGAVREWKIKFCCRLVRKHTHKSICHVIF